MSVLYKALATAERERRATQATYTAGPAAQGPGRRGGRRWGLLLAGLLLVTALGAGAGWLGYQRLMPTPPGSVPADDGGETARSPVTRLLTSPAMPLPTAKTPAPPAPPVAPAQAATTPAPPAPPEPSAASGATAAGSADAQAPPDRLRPADVPQPRPRPATAGTAQAGAPSDPPAPPEPASPRDATGRQATLAEALTDQRADGGGASRRQPERLDVAALMRVGNRALANDRPERAGLAFLDVLAVEPANRPARLGLAEALLAADMPAEAATTYRALLAETPGNGEVRAGLARALRAAGARNELAGLARRFPDDPRFPANLAMLQAQRGQLDVAIGHFQDAVALAPVNPHYHYNLAVVADRAGRTALAAEHYARTLTLLERGYGRGLDPAGIRARLEHLRR